MTKTDIVIVDDGQMKITRKQIRKILIKESVSSKRKNHQTPSDSERARALIRSLLREAVRESK
tara:strand:- start:19 stop:207 length:189 start_codon:yes stop_codon:yes gene_type:complete